MLQSYAAWDRGTRWFHWVNALSVLALGIVGFVMLQAADTGASNPGRVALERIHTAIGCVFLLNLAWRFAWAFRGNRHAVRRCLASFLDGRPEPGADPAPPGAVGATALLLLITALGLTGLVLAGTEFFFERSGSLAHLRGFREPFLLVHEYGSYVLVAVVAMHVATAIVAALREGGSLIAAMLTGRKVPGGRPRDPDREGD